MRAMLWTIVGIACVFVGAIGVVIGGVIIVGLLLPVGHTATSRVEVNAAPQEIWPILLDASEHATWRTGVTGIDVSQDDDGTTCWVEHNTFGTIAMRLETVEPPTRLMTRIADDSLPFGGTWTWTLTPKDDADGASGASGANGANGAESTNITIMRITENGEVRQPIFRSMSRFVMGYHRTMDGYLRDLARRFDGDAQPVHEG